MIKNWDRFQHYKKKESPSWIKLYTSTLSDIAFRSLRDQSKLLLFHLWILSASNQNKLDLTRARLARACGIRVTNANIKELIDSGFLVPHDQVKSIDKVYTQREEKRRGEREEKRREEKPPNPPGVSVTSFDLFWSHYPKKRKKADARKAWEKLKPWQTGDQVNMILWAIENQKRSKQWTKEDGDFIPLPASWLRGECWLDEVGVDVLDDGLPRGGNPHNDAVLRKILKEEGEIQ